jgi:hypothetical protein
VGGDEDADPKAEGAQTAALKGAGIGVGVGGLIGAAGGPIGAAAGAAVGAYVGSLAGALSGIEENVESKPDDANAVRRPGGVIVAVNIEGQAAEQEVASILRDSGAGLVERADGEWRDGQWVDFDPVAPPRLVEDSHLLAREPVVFRVLTAGSGRWKVIEAGIDKALSDFQSRDEAVRYATALAHTKARAVVEVIGPQGQVESSNRFSMSTTH